MTNLDTSGFMDLISGVHGGQFEYVDDMPLDNCYPDLEQPRYKSLTEDGVQDIVATLPFTNGRIWQPIIVREEDGDGHKILMGGRRWLASKVYGSDSIPVIIVKGDIDSALFLQLVENIARKPLDIREEGRSYKLLKEQGQDQKDIATSLNKSPGYITEAIMMHDMEINDEFSFINKLYEDNVCRDTSTLAVLIRLARKDTAKTGNLVDWALENDCLNRKWAKSLSAKSLDEPFEDQIKAFEERLDNEIRPKKKAGSSAGMTGGEGNSELSNESSPEPELSNESSPEPELSNESSPEPELSNEPITRKKRVTEINVTYNGDVASLLLDRTDGEEGFAWIKYIHGDAPAFRVKVTELSLIFVG